MLEAKRLLPSRDSNLTREVYLKRLKCINPVNVWYVTTLCEDLVLYMENYKLHIWAIGSTVTGLRPQRNYNKPQDIDLLVTHDGMLDGAAIIKDRSYFPTEFEEMFLKWVKRQSARFKIIESGFYGRLLGSGCLEKLGGAFLVPKVWSETPINFIVPSESKGGKEELEKIRHGALVVLYPKT